MTDRIELGGAFEQLSLVTELVEGAGTKSNDVALLWSGQEPHIAFIDRKSVV